MNAEWEDAAERDHAALALVTSTIENDPALMAAAVAPLGRGQIVELCVVIAGWFCWAAGEAGLDAREHVRRVAMDLARRASGLDPDDDA